MKSQCISATTQLWSLLLAQNFSLFQLTIHSSSSGTLLSHLSLRFPHILVHTQCFSLLGLFQLSHHCSSVKRVHLSLTHSVLTSRSLKSLLLLLGGFLQFHLPCNSFLLNSLLLDFIDLVFSHFYILLFCDLNRVIWLRFSHSSQSFSSHLLFIIHLLFFTSNYPLFNFIPSLTCSAIIHLSMLSLDHAYLHFLLLPRCLHLLSQLILRLLVNIPLLILILEFFHFLIQIPVMVGGTNLQ